jgi:hypothetical protein
MTIEKDKQTAVVSARRTMLKASLVVIPLASLALSSAASAQAKIAQSMVQYQEKPNGASECDKCAQFIAPGSCKVVDGKINPKGWCVAFAPKA